MKSINKYCPKLLHELNIYHLESDTLKQLTHPFERVENVLLSFSLEHLETGIHPLNQLFPYVCRLTTLLLRWDMDGDFINVALSHSEHLSVTFVYEHSIVNENKIATLLRQNSHIQSIALYIFFNEVNELVPNLKNFIHGKHCRF